MLLCCRLYTYYVCMSIGILRFLSFWTSYCPLSTLTSNPPRLGFSFGLSTAFSPLQRPIHHTLASLLDFLMPSLLSNVQSRRALASLLDFLVPSLLSNVQSAMLWLPFLTFCYACIIICNTSTANTLIATHF